MGINLEKILDVIETPVVFIDSKYCVSYINSAAEKLIGGKDSFLDIIDETYWPIFENGIKNNFPFVLSEKRILKKKILTTSADSYKLIVKPVEENLYLVEFIKTGAVQKTNTLLIKKNRDFIKHSNILSDLMKIKSGKDSIDSLSGDEIIKLYEEQLSLQFAIDDAVNKTIAPIVDGNLTINDAANLILTEIRNIIDCAKGLIIAKKDEGYYIIDKFDNDGEPEKVADISDLCKNMTSFKKPVYYNDMPQSKCLPKLSYDSKDLKNIMIVPLAAENMNYGFLILADCADAFTEMHLKIATRLGQLFSLAIQRSEYLKQLNIQANNDALTGCYNRRYALDSLAGIYADANTKGTTFSLLFFDINNLKKVNDVLGHEHGDDLIKSFADTARKMTRGNEIFARYGGDEFILIVPGCTLETAHRIENRIQNAIKTFNESSKKPFEVNASVGSVQYTKESKMTLDELIAEADAVMYENKRQYKLKEKSKDESGSCR